LRGSPFLGMPATVPRRVTFLITDARASFASESRRASNAPSLLNFYRGLKGLVVPIHAILQHPEKQSPYAQMIRESVEGKRYASAVMVVE